MKKWGCIFILFVQTFVLVSLTVFCVLPFSCKVTEEGIIFTGGDYASPVLEDVCVLDDRNVRVSFSEKVKLRAYTVSEQIKDISDSDEHSQTIELSPALKAASGGYGSIEAGYSLSEDGCSIIYSAAECYEVGKAYEIFGVVEDKAGNSLTFCVPFTGFNSHMPKLVMTELQINYKKYKEDVYRCEFIEFLALKEGNLSGLEIVSGADGEGKKFVFPPVNVKAGEVFIVHLRSAGSGCITEEENLNASTAAYSGKNVRDIWSENTKARLSDNTDIVLVRNGVDGTILDAFMYAAESATEWGKGMSLLAEDVVECGIYEEGSVCEAEVNSGLGSVAGKSFQRLDAAALQEAALAGSFQADDAEYPVKQKPDNWVIKNVSPGTL